jgi:glycosyltransferase involved in cell wall biosynthesis
MKIAQVYPHSVISVPHAEIFDALAIVNYEIGRRLAQTHAVVTYPKCGKGQRELERHEGVTYRRMSERFDSIVNLLRVLDKGVLKPERPFRLSPFYYAHYARRVALDIRARQCQLIHIHSVTNFIPVMRAVNPKAHVVLHMHDHSLSDFDPAVVGPRLEQASLIVGCSDFVIDSVRKRFPTVASRCHTLYNGVDRRFLDIHSDPARSSSVLFVGRLCPEKGVHVLLDAVSKLPANQPLPEVNLVGPLDVAPKEFVDPLSQDPLFKGLESYYSRPTTFQEQLQRQAAGLGDRAILHGRVLNSDIGEHYAKAGIFVFPSLWHEPFGIPVIEAMAAGLPVVATRGGALPEIVVHGETGFLVERGDVEGLSKAISTLVVNPALRARMGAAGRARVREMFTWEHCVYRLNQLYALSTERTGSDQFLLGMSNPRTTAGRATNASSALVTCANSAMPTSSPAP